jgi:hypothetical protein
MLHPSSWSRYLSAAWEGRWYAGKKCKLFWAGGKLSRIGGDAWVSA